MKKVLTIIVIILSIIGGLAFLYFGITGEGYQFIGGILGRAINILFGICILVNVWLNKFKF